MNELKDTIEELKSGHHDIRLEGVSQEDMVTILQDCQSSPELQAQLHEHDPSGTLAAFWKEQVSSNSHSNPNCTPTPTPNTDIINFVYSQVERSQTTLKRKQWNPIVLRFMLHLWEKMGEKHFRLLEKEKVMCGLGVGRLLPGLICILYRLTSQQYMSTGVVFAIQTAFTATKA